MEINILELPKLPDEYNGDRLWGWGRFLKAEKAEEFAMVAEKVPEVKKAVVRLMELSEDERNEMIADRRWIWETDVHNIKVEFMEKGREEGRASGLAEGREQGLAEGEQKGKREICEIARRLKARGRPAAEIADITGLSAGEVEHL
jgi:predicted transposase/invertase (TIGR01784 family)